MNMNGKVIFPQKLVIKLRKKCLYLELFWSVFFVIRTESLRIQSKYAKIRTRITLNKDSFHAVL